MGGKRKQRGKQKGNRQKVMFWSKRKCVEAKCNVLKQKVKPEAKGNVWRKIFANGNLCEGLVIMWKKGTWNGLGLLRFHENISDQVLPVMIVPDTVFFLILELYRSAKSWWQLWTETPNYLKRSLTSEIVSHNTDQLPSCSAQLIYIWILTKTLPIAQYGLPGWTTQC